MSTSIIALMYNRKLSPFVRTFAYYPGSYFPFFQNKTKKLHVLFLCLGPFHFSRRVWWPHCALWSHCVSWKEPSDSPRGGPSMAECSTCQLPLLAGSAACHGRRHQWVQDHYAQPTPPELQGHQGECSTGLSQGRLVRRLNPAPEGWLFMLKKYKQMVRLCFMNTHSLSQFPLPCEVFLDAIKSLVCLVYFSDGGLVSLTYEIWTVFFFKSQHSTGGGAARL